MHKLDVIYPVLFAMEGFVFFCLLAVVNMSRVVVTANDHKLAIRCEVERVHLLITLSEHFADAQIL